MQRWPLLNSKSSAIRRRAGFLFFLVFSIATLIQQNAYADIVPVHKEVLDNRATVIQYADPNQEMVAIDWFLPIGSANEGEFQGSGIAHILEHMIFKGAEGGKAGELAQKIRLMGGEVNAATSLDFTHYFILVPKQYYLDCLKLLGEAVLNPTLDNSDFEKELEVVLREFHYRETIPTQYQYKILLETLYKQHPYQYPPIGVKDRLENVKIDAVKKFYRDNYRPANMTITVVGDIDTKETKKIVAELFQQRTETNPFALSWDVAAKPQVNRQIKTITPTWPFKTAKTTYIFPTNGYNSEYYFELEVLGLELSEGRSSRLYQRFQSAGNIALGIDAYHAAFSQSGFFVLDVTSNLEHVPDVERILNEEIIKIQSELIKNKALSKARKSIQQSFIQQKEDPGSLAFYLAYFDAIIGSYSYLFEFEENINQVSANRVREAAQKILSNQVKIVFKGTPFDERSETIKDNLESQATQVDEIQRHKFEQGITLLHQLDKRQPNAVIHIFFQGGSSFETESNAGIFELLTRMMLRRTRQFDSYTLQSKIESLGASITASAGNNSISLSFTVLKDDFVEALTYLYDITSHPQFESEALAAEKQLLLSAIDAEEDNIFASASRQLRKSLYQKHPYRYPTVGNKDSIQNISLDDLSDYFTTFIQKSAMVISIAGDVSADSCIAAVTKLWASTPQQRNMPEFNSIVQFTRASNESFESAFDESVVIVGLPGASITNSDYTALSLWGEIFGGLDGVLSQKLREEQGLVYTTGASQVVGLQPGFMAAYGLCDKSKADQVLEQIQTVILNFRSYATDELIQKAKAGMIGSLKSQMNQKGLLSYQAGLYEVFGLGFEKFIHRDEDIQAIDSQALIDVGEKYFQKGSLHGIIMASQIRESNAE